MVWHTTCHDSSSREKKIEMIVMKIEIPFLAVLLILGADLLARVSVQGVEQALFSTALEWSMKRIREGRQKFSSKGAGSDE